MKFGLTSDLHLGLTSANTLNKFFARVSRQAQEEDWAFLVVAGDFCGGQDGARSVATLSKMMRDHLPTLPILAVLGNHDMWVKSQRKVSCITEQNFHENYHKIVNVFSSQAIHFLDLDGPYRPNDYIAVVGHSLWYQSTTPTTNDHYHLPSFVRGEPIHTYLSNRHHRELSVSLTKLTKADVVRIFVSHFPIIDSGNAIDWHFAGPYGLERILRNEFGFGMFLNGHTHRLACVPGHFCCDSDYYKPRVLAVEI